MKGDLRETNTTTDEPRTRSSQGNVARKSENGDHLAAPGVRHIPRFAFLAGGQEAVRQLGVGLVKSQR
jgi:hypothetical protein